MASQNAYLPQCVGEYPDVDVNHHSTWMANNAPPNAAPSISIGDNYNYGDYRALPTSPYMMPPHVEDNGHYYS